MPNFTTDFRAIPASEINVHGVPAGAVAAQSIPLEILSSLAGLFAISADTTGLIGDLRAIAAPIRLAA
jgi:hypothetical protein